MFSWTEDCKPTNPHFVARFEDSSGSIKLNRTVNCIEYVLLDVENDTSKQNCTTISPTMQNLVNMINK